jgi:hypothetical protein
VPRSRWSEGKARGKKTLTRARHDTARAARCLKTLLWRGEGDSEEADVACELIAEFLEDVRELNEAYIKRDG